MDLSGFYSDGDGDGHGIPDPNLMTFVCPYATNGQAPAGYSLFDDDCDDTDPNISPSSPEYCTASIDENCDGHNSFEAIDVVTYLADTDYDGYGNPDYMLELCVIPIGYVPYIQGDDVDCNDNDGTVMPNLPVENEICNGKLDRCENEWNGTQAPVEEVDLDGFWGGSN